MQTTMKWLGIWLLTCQSSPAKRDIKEESLIVYAHIRVFSSILASALAWHFRSDKSQSA